MCRDDQPLAGGFEHHRSRLIGLAYRLTGERDDAEDAVQEAWLRLARLDAAARAEIADLGRWLTTVVGRICLDRMRSASARREHYVGPWLPEPVVTELGAQSQNPLDAVVTREDLRMVAVRVLHELSADQRLAFVLHDGFEVPFAEIADLLGCGVSAARQHASRARRAVAGAAPPPPSSMADQHRLLEQFLTAVSARDIDALTRVLHPDVAVVSDTDGKARAARRPVVGSEKVARFAVGLAEKYQPDLLTGLRAVLVNGEPGVLLPGSPGTEQATRKIARRVMTVAVRDGRIAAIYEVVNPDKLIHLPRPAGDQG